MNDPSPVPHELRAVGVTEVPKTVPLSVSTATVAVTVKPPQASAKGATERAIGATTQLAATAETKALNPVNPVAKPRYDNLKARITPE